MLGVGLLLLASAGAYYGYGLLADLKLDDLSYKTERPSPPGPVVGAPGESGGNTAATTVSSPSSDVADSNSGSPLSEDEAVVKPAAKMGGDAPAAREASTVAQEASEVTRTEPQQASVAGAEEGATTAATTDARPSTDVNDVRATAAEEASSFHVETKPLSTSEIERASDTAVSSITDHEGDGSGQVQRPAAEGEAQGPEQVDIALSIAGDVEAADSGPADPGLQPTAGDDELRASDASTTEAEDFVGVTPDITWTLDDTQRERLGLGPSPARTLLAKENVDPWFQSYSLSASLPSDQILALQEESDGYSALVAAELREPQPASRISIPAIDLDSEVRELKVITVGDSAAWETPQRIVGHIPTTARPGVRGEGWYFGHLESPISGGGNVFLRLWEIPKLLHDGETVHVLVEADSRRYVYQVYETRWVPQERLRITDSGLHDITLVTCWPRFRYDKRLLVTAALVDVVEIDRLDAGQL